MAKPLFYIDEYIFIIISISSWTSSPTASAGRPVPGIHLLMQERLTE
jgi:hypothetical protein